MTVSRGNGNAAEARAMQAQDVSLKDGFSTRLQTVAGFDVGGEEDGEVVRAAAALLDAVTLHPIAMRVARVRPSTPYGPGLLGFRELPALLGVLDLLPQRPDLAFVHGHGIAHPRRFGIAAHFGVAADLPTIGVATTILVGDGIIPHPMRGAIPLCAIAARRLDGCCAARWIATRSWFHPGTAWPWLPPPTW